MWARLRRVLANLSLRQRVGHDRLLVWSHVADVLVVVLASLTVAAALYPLRIAVVDLTIRRWWRPLIAAIVISVLRHAVIETPSLRSKAASVWTMIGTRRQAVVFAISVAIVTRAAVLLVGYFGTITIPFPADAPFAFSRASAWWDLPRRWDAGWYLSIAKDGYQWTGDVASSQNLNFFPAYPLLLRAIASLGSPPHVSDEAALAWTATSISIAVFAAAVTYLYWFADEQFGSAVAERSIVLLASYPFAVFFGAVYSESLFLLSAVAAWYHARRDEPIPAIAFGLIAGLCRPNGALLSIPLLLEMAGRRNSSVTGWATAVAPLVGVVLFSVFAYRLTSHPFVWVESQRAAFGRTYQSFNDTIWPELKTLADIGIVQYVGAWPWRTLNLAPTLLSLGTVWPIARRLGVAAGAFVLVNTLLPLLNGGLVSMGRYTSVLFPIFVWLAIVVDRRWFALLVWCFGIGQAAVAISFYTWRQIF